MIRIIKKIFDVILLLIIITLCKYYILSVFNQFVIYNVKTGSMENNIHAGDYILIAKQESYKVGDIITYENGDDYITHRIIMKCDDEIITKGDANNIEDETINTKSIVGRVIIIGGVLNFIINYKYIIVCSIICIYLVTCYFDNSSDEY